MHIKGSCYCGAVRFSLNAATPVPYLRCYCSICRKTAGGGGFAINLGGLKDSLSVQGDDCISVFNAMIDGQQSPAERRFCSKCGSALWVWDPRWPELVHPFASAIDSALPKPPEHVHIMLSVKPDWVCLDEDQDETCFQQYPDRSLKDWHTHHGLLSPEPD